MNIMDYLDMRGDLTFSERPFNEVDNLIFSELAYLDMNGIVDDSIDFTVTIAELCEKYLALGYDQSYIINDPKPLLKKAAETARFKDIRVGAYVDKVAADEQVQFACATFVVGDGTAYVGYRGTDNTIVGWREDFNISYLSETPGQSEAAAYLNRIAGHTDYSLRVGGHSKGGNFAVYAAAFCKEAVRRDRVIEVYSNDGPGFNQSVVESKQYASILEKVTKIIPESSLIGILLSSKVKPKVINSEVKGLLQHDPYTWSVRGTVFEEADGFSSASLFMDETLKKWLNTLNDEEKKAVVSAIFDSLDASGASTLTEMNENKWVSYNAILKAVSRISKTTYGEVAESLKKLAEAGKDVLWNEAKKSFEQFEQSRRGQAESQETGGKKALPAHGN